MKTHHIANLILIAVLATAFIGMYYVFKGPGRAIDLAQIETDTIGYCCCQDGGAEIFKTASEKLSKQLLPSDCAATCYESKAQSLGQC